MKLEAAALVPAYNEAATIAEVVRGVLPFVSEVLVVDDGSTDATAREARAAGARVISHERNQGKGRAVRTGLVDLLRRDLTHVVVLDGDLQHVPQETRRLLDTALSTSAEIVIGERRFDRSTMPPSRYYANRIGSRALSWFVGVPVEDTQCGFRVFRAEALRGLRLSATGYEIETEMLVKLRRLGGRVASVPVTAVYNGHRSKLRPIRDTTRTCFLAVYYRFLERL